MQTSQSRWQNTINPKLLQRLLRSPGVIRSHVADSIRSRSDWSNRLPLLTQISQRHATTEGLQTGQAPIVYAQPLPAESSSNAATNTVTSIDSSTSQQKPTTVIQAKFAPGSTSAHQKMGQVKANAVQPSVRSNQSSATPNIPAIENAQASSADTEPSQPLLQFALPVVLARSPRLNVSIPTAIVPESSLPSENSLPVVQAKLAHHSLLPTQSTANETLSSSQEYQPQNLASSQEGDRFATASPDKLVVRPVAEERAIRINAKELNQPAFASATHETNSIRSASPEFSSQQASIDQANVLRSKRLPLVRSAPPQSELNRDAPLVFSQSPADAANRNRSSSVLPTVTPNNSLDSSVLETPTSTAQKSGSNASVVRSIPQQIIQEVEETASLLNQAPQTIARATPSSPPAIDVDALADKVERKLMRRMIIERERRGWK